MKRIQLIPFQILLIIIFLLSFTFVNGTTYFINNKIGNDANQGTTKDSPWKGFPNLENNIFQPGDSILFADGTNYKGGFIFKCSGTIEKPIVFSHYYMGSDIITTTPREKLENLFPKYGGGPAPSFTNPDWNVINGNIFNINASYIIIDGLYFHDNTNPPESDHKNKNVQKMGVVYLALGSNHNIIKNCEFFNTPVGIKVKGSYNLISHNYMHDATEKLAYSWGPIAIMIVKPYNEICYNKIVNYGSYGGPYGSDGGVVEIDGVDDDYEGHHIDIHHNISINNHGFLELAGRNMDNITIAYNLSDDTNQFVGGGSMTNIFVNNNTIIRTREPNVDRYIFWTFVPDSTSMVIKNNIFVLPHDIQVYGPFVKQVGHHRSRIGNQPHDHNLYYTVGNSNPDPLGGIAKGKGDIIGDPLFIDNKNGNYRLQPNSPARKSGTKLNYSCNLDGYPIQKNETPNIGVY